jgi:hypothetical protein
MHTPLKTTTDDGASFAVIANSLSMNIGFEEMKCYNMPILL